MTFGKEGTEGKKQAQFDINIGNHLFTRKAKALVFIQSRPLEESLTSSKPMDIMRHVTLLCHCLWKTPDGQQLDTALLYGAMSSEQLLGEVGWKERGLVMDTKLYPLVVRSRVCTGN